MMARYGIRLVVGFLVFLFFKITNVREIGEVFNWGVDTTIYMLFVIGVLLLIWEVTTIIVRRFKRRTSPDVASKGQLVKLFFVSALAAFPLVILSTWLFDFHIRSWFEAEECCSSTYFWVDTVQGMVITWLIIVSEVLKLYIEHAVTAAREKAMMQQELFVAKYKSLKNQIHPHFLFNSFSVLSSLVGENPKTAEQFISKLSKLYRYILENDEYQTVSLSKELSFLDHYFFLLKTRHGSAIELIREIDLKTDVIQLPALSLQILVENAVTHNLFSEQDPLKIRVYNEGDDYLVVKNELRKKREVTPSTHIGLENLGNRFKLYFKREIQVISNQNYFTVKLPIKAKFQLAS